MELPHRKLYIHTSAQASEEILQYARHLEVLGERPWFEVRYSPEGLDPAEKADWLRKQEDVFDAVEVIDGEIHTLPPYEELMAHG